MKNKVRQLKYEDSHTNFQKRLEFVQNSRQPIALLLDGLTDVRNIGSLFRLADAANIEKVFLYRCPTFDPNHKKVQRTSRSTIQYIDFESLQGLDTITTLQERYTLVALEITNESVIYTDFEPTKPTLLAIGNERQGVSNELLQLCDQSIHLPMYGMKTSMNVLCATGIAVYHLLEKIKP